MIDANATAPEVLAYCYQKLGREGLEEVLSRASSFITKEALTDYIEEYKLIGLTSLAAILEEKKEKAPSKSDIHLCTWTLTYRSLEDMKVCNLPDGKGGCNCLINREYWR